MTHDPLCPVRPEVSAGIPTDGDVAVVMYETVAVDTRCECDLIAQVRADMRQRVEVLGYYIDTTDPQEQGYNAGRAMALDVLSTQVIGS